MRIGNHTSSKLTLNTGPPRGVSSAPCLLTNNDESAYREEVSELALCQDNNLSLNVSKTKELIVDIRKQKREHAPIHINGTAVKRVSS